MAGAWGTASARGITVAGDTPAITVVGGTPAITVDMEDMEATVTAPRMGIHPRFIFNGRKHRAQQKPANYWYYCRNPEGYYPYVKQCTAGWIPVPPEPSDQ